MSSHEIEYYYTYKIFSWLFFLIGCACVAIFFIYDMTQFLILGLAFTLFIWSYFVSPHRKNPSYDAPNFSIDEWLIEFVFRLITWPFRIIKAIFSSGSIDLSF